MFHLLLGAVLAFLPQAYRGRLATDADLSRGSMLSGLLQALFCLAYLIYRYLIYGHQMMFGKGMETVGLSALEKGGETALMGLGPIMLFAFLLQPLSIMLIYFLFEGIVRGAAATVTGEVVPTLPLQIVYVIHSAIQAKAKEAAMGPRVIDLVQLLPGPDYDLMIESCRPKRWDKLLTISYQDKFYELVTDVEQTPPRRFVYLLRKNPESKVIRGLYSYDPSEVMEK